MERKDHGKEVLPCHPQAASLGPGTRMLAWTARGPQKRLRLGPGLCTTMVSFRAVCSKLAFLRPRTAARHLVQVPPGSTKGVSQRQGRIFSTVASLSVQAVSPRLWFFCLKAKPEGLRQAGIVSKDIRSGLPTMSYPTPPCSLEFHSIICIFCGAETSRMMS